jgi:outer membrane protein assembly factor BamB
MYQNPPRYVPGPPQAVYRSVARRRPLIVLLLLPFLLFGLAFFGGSYAMAPEPDIEVQPGFAFVGAGGRDLLLVPYERHGARGMFQTMTQDLFQVRLAALDPDTGETLWDTQLSGELVWTASVLGGGRKYAYVATDAGLVIVAMGDGSVVAEGAGVAGLGDAFLAARSAYAYDAEGRRVLALTATGEVLAIPLDEAKAVPVDGPLPAQWSGRLSQEPAPEVPSEVTAAEAALASGTERVALRDLPFGLGQELVHVMSDGRRNSVGGTSFHGARLVVGAGGVAVGAASGHVLVQHQPVNGSGFELSMVLPDNVQVTDTLAVEHAVARAVIGPDGSAAVATGQDLVLVSGDGRLTRADIGATNFFGSPE